MSSLETFVESVVISPDIFDLRPDFAVLVVGVEGGLNGPSDGESRGWLKDASEIASVTDHQPHLEAWRDAYRSFGVKPQKFRPSFDALLRRANAGLPEINKVVDAYNAISVKYGLPVGGENIDAYNGTLRLIRSDGTETFDTVTDGQPVTETIEAGEVAWCDDSGVTCRRWNWRQCVRTQVDETNDRVFFVFERLEPFPLDLLHEAGQELLDRITSPKSHVVTRLVQAVPA